MNNMNARIIIRKGTKEDAEGKGYVHYTSWIETYTGLFDQKYLDNISLEKCIKTAYNHPENTYVALSGDKIVGFACYMKALDSDLINSGEVVAIYVLKDYQGVGLGKKLLHACIAELNAYDKIILWVLKDNKTAIEFYESQGFIKDGKTKILYEKEVIRMVKQ